MDARMFIVRRFDAPMLDVGRWTLETLDIGPLDVVHHVGRCTFGCSDVRMLDLGRCTLDVVGLCWTLLDFGRWDAGRWTLDVGWAVGCW